MAARAIVRRYLRHKRLKRRRNTLTKLFRENVIPNAHEPKPLPSVNPTPLGYNPAKGKYSTYESKGSNSDSFPCIFPRTKISFSTTYGFVSFNKLNADYPCARDVIYIEDEAFDIARFATAKAYKIERTNLVLQRIVRYQVIEFDEKNEHSFLLEVTDECRKNTIYHAVVLEKSFKRGSESLELCSWSYICDIPENNDSSRYVSWHHPFIAAFLGGFILQCIAWLGLPLF